MNIWRTTQNYPIRREASPATSRILFLIIAAVAAVPVISLLWFVPAAPVLPALSLISIAAAALLAIFAWAIGARREQNRVGIWDYAFASAFVGFAAGMISRPEQTLALFGFTMPLN